MEEMSFTTMKTKRNIWEEFCYDLIEARDKNVLEDEYQAIVETNLRQLGWSKVQGEICPKERINVGSHNQIEPDITIKTNNFVYSLEDGYEEFREKVIGLDYDEILEMYIENLVHPFEMPHWQKKKNYLYFKDKILPQIKYLARLR